MIIVGASAVVWIATTLATPPVEQAQLRAFLRRVRPGSPGWSAFAGAHRIAQQPFLRRAAVDWLAGCGLLFGACFGLGALLLGRPALGAVRGGRRGAALAAAARALALSARARGGPPSPSVALRPRRSGGRRVRARGLSGQKELQRRDWPALPTLDLVKATAQPAATMQL